MKKRKIRSTMSVFLTTFFASADYITVSVQIIYC